MSSIKSDMILSPRMRYIQAPQPTLKLAESYRDLLSTLVVLVLSLALNGEVTMESKSEKPYSEFIKHYFRTILISLPAFSWMITPSWMVISWMFTSSFCQ